MTDQKRAHDVEQMNANMAIEGLQPDADDVKLQADYVKGLISTEDMLQHAREFGEKKAAKGQS